MILCCKWFSSLPASYRSWTTRTAIDVGETVSTPHTILKGDMPIDFFWVTLSAHSALTNFLCHLFMFVSNSFLMMWTKDLFEDSTLWIVCSWVAQGNLIFITKISHLFRFESCCIICNQLIRTTKTWQNIVLKKLNYYCINGLSSRNHLYPFSEVVCRCKDPFVLCWRSRMDLTNKI